MGQLERLRLLPGRCTPLLERLSTRLSLLLLAVSQELQEPEHVLVPHQHRRPIAVHSGQASLVYGLNEFDVFAKPEASAEYVNVS